MEVRDLHFDILHEETSSVLFCWFVFWITINGFFHSQYDEVSSEIITVCKVQEANLLFCIVY